MKRQKMMEWLMEIWVGTDSSRNHRLAPATLAFPPYRHLTPFNPPHSTSLMVSRLRWPTITVHSVECGTWLVSAIACPCLLLGRLWKFYFSSHSNPFDTTSSSYMWGALRRRNHHSRRLPCRNSHSHVHVTSHDWHIFFTTQKRKQTSLYLRGFESLSNLGAFLRY